MTEKPAVPASRSSGIGVQAPKPATNRVETSVKIITILLALIGAYVSLLEFHERAAIDLEKHELDARLAYLNDFSAAAGSDAPTIVAELIASQKRSAQVSWLLAIHRHLSHESRLTNVLFHPRDSWSGDVYTRPEYQAGHAYKQHLHSRSSALLALLITKIRVDQASIEDSRLASWVELAVSTSMNLRDCETVAPLLGDLRDSQSTLARRVPGTVTQIDAICRSAKASQE